MAAAASKRHSSPWVRRDKGRRSKFESSKDRKVEDRSISRSDECLVETMRQHR